MLEGSNLPKETNKLVRTTVLTFDFKNVKNQLRKLEDSAATSDKIDVDIKDEPDDTFYGNDNFHNQDTRGRSRGGTWSGRGGRGDRGGRGRGGRGRRGGRSGLRNRGYVRGSCYACRSPDHYINECPNRNNDTESENNIEEGFWNEHYQDEEAIEIYL